MALQVITYSNDALPTAEVWIDDPDGGSWHSARVARWVQRGDASWWAYCSVTRAGATHWEFFQAPAVRLDETEGGHDRS